MPGIGFPVGEVPDVLVGERPRLLVLLLGDRALEAAQDVPLLPVELGRGEAEPRDALGLGEERLEAALDPVVLHAAR